MIGVPHNGILKGLCPLSGVQGQSPWGEVGMIRLAGCKTRGSKRWLRREVPLHLMLMPGVVVILIYGYLPMLGLVMVFQKFNPFLSFAGSQWVGWDNFRYLFSLANFGQLFRNTVEIAVAKIILGQIVPLGLALLLNEVHSRRFSRVSQTVFFLPYFLSWVILGGVFRELFSMNGGINTLLYALTGEKIFFLGDNLWFRLILIVTDVWKGMGYNMIIYLAAITNVDPALYEAAAIDGCNRVQQCRHVTLPGLRPMIVLLATLSIGGILNAGFDQIFNMYNTLVYESADIVDTFVYRLGMINRQYSVSAALGVFKSLISLVFVGAAYYGAYRFSDYRIF